LPPGLTALVTRVRKRDGGSAPARASVDPLRA
jgi:hypothetical protein